MARYKIQAPDGSIIELDGPDNATDAQLIQAAQAAYAQRQQGAQAPAVATAPAPAPAAAAARPAPAMTPRTAPAPAPAMAVPAAPAPAVAAPVATAPAEPPKMGFFESIGEMVTGARRTTPETLALPEWTAMPELNQMSMSSFKSALGTLLTNPQETVQILQSNFPGLQARQDAKGNYILRSSVNQKEYAIPPGASVGDLPRILGGLFAFTPAGRAATIPGAALKAGATQAGIEATQSGIPPHALLGDALSVGGEFNLGEVGLATATGPAGQIIQRVAPPAAAAVRRGVQRATGRAPAAPSVPAAPRVEPTFDMGPPTGAPAAQLQALEFELEMLSSQPIRQGESRGIREARLGEVQQQIAALRSRPAPAPPAPAAAPPVAPAAPPAAAAIPEAPPPAPGPAGAPMGTAMAPEVPPAAAAAETMTAEQLTATTKQAAGGGFGSTRATQILATQAAPDPKVLEAARRLGIEQYLQPDHLTSNQAYRELAQAVKSVPGSQTRAAEIVGLQQVGKRADDLITEIGGMTDLSQMNQAVRNNLSQTVATLERKADDAYAQLRANIPAQTRGSADNVLNFIEQRVRDLDGAENLSAMEKYIRGKLSPKPIKDSQGNVIGTRLPTYALIDDVRKEIGAAAREKGVFKDADTGAAKNLYSLIDDDQFNLAETLGRGEQYRAAKSLVSMRKGIEDDMVSLFGKQLDQALVTKLSTATTALSKGDAEKLVNILAAIPKDMRKMVSASALNTAFGKATQNGDLNFGTYANWYEGLLNNKQAYTALMNNLPQDSKKALSNLYRVAANVNKATRERITTGRIQAIQEDLQGADTLIGNLYTAAKRSAVGLPVEAVTSSFGFPGAGLASGVTAALMKGNKPKVIKLADELLASPEFQKLATEQSQAAIRRTAMSKAFSDFAKEANLPQSLDARVQYLQSAIQAGRQFEQENEQ